MDAYETVSKQWEMAGRAVQRPINQCECGQMMFPTIRKSKDFTIYDWRCKCGNRRQEIDKK